MTSPRTLAELLFSGSENLRRACFDPGALAPLEATKLVRSAGAVERIVCDNCEEPHGADVRRGPVGWQIRCRDHGWLDVDGDEVAAIVVDLDIVASAIAGALAARGRVRRVGDLWSLGRTRLRADVIATLFFAPVVDSIARTRSALATVANEAQADVSVVIAGWMDCLPPNALASSIRFVALEDICSIVPPDGLKIDMAGLADIVLGPAAPKRLGGRPVVYGDQLLERLDQIWPRGEPRPQPGAALKELKRLWRSDKPPSRQTVRRRLDKIEKHRTMN